MLPGSDPTQGEERDIPNREDANYEDWTKPSLTPGMQSEVVSLGETPGPGFTRELLHAQWRDLDPIDVWVIRPVGVKKPPVVLYLYSYPSSNDRYRDDAFCQFLIQNGFAAVGFVPALTEQRFHDRPRRDWFVSQLQEAMATSAHDVQMVLNYLEHRGDFDMSRAGMWGDGAGASIAILTAAVDPRLKVLDLLNPWGDWPNWLAKSGMIPEGKRDEYLKPEFLKSLEHLDPINYLPKLTTQAVRLQQIGDVRVTPELVRQHLEAAAPADAKIVRYETTKAFVENVASKGTGFAWIKSELASSLIRQNTAQNISTAKPGKENSSNP